MNYIRTIISFGIRIMTLQSSHSFGAALSSLKSSSSSLSLNRSSSSTSSARSNAFHAMVPYQ